MKKNSRDEREFSLKQKIADKAIFNKCPSRSILKGHGDSNIIP